MGEFTLDSSQVGDQTAALAQDSHSGYFVLALVIGLLAIAIARDFFKK